MFENRILLPHQYYYPNMNFLNDRSTIEKEEKFYLRCKESSEKKRMATIYIHIPFCNSRCAFCGFDKEYQLEETGRYVDKVIEEITYYSNLLKNTYTIQSIHFGGGTPTILPAEYLQKLLDAVKQGFSMAEDVSIDIEGSATTLYREDIIQFIQDNNITRISFGIQSFDENIREEMKLKATKEDVFHTLDILKKNHIMAFGDILYGYPDFRTGDLREILKKDIETAIEVGLDGVELGQMYPFKNPLEKIVKERNLTLPSDEEIISIIELATNMLEAAGYTQTTYSGFTKNGKIILETSYFGGIEEMPDCIAMGSGAFGSICGYKYRNASYHVYMTQKTPCFGQLKEMTKEQIENMQIVGFPKVLVLNKGLFRTPEIWQRFSHKFETLKEQGMIEENEKSFYLTRKGKNYIDNIYWYLLEEEEKEFLKKDIVIYVSERKSEYV